jgi:hypothetical protein
VKENVMEIQRGTVQADMPHPFKATGYESDGVIVVRECAVCAGGVQAPAHRRYAEMAAASRESASTSIPRVHG